MNGERKVILIRVDASPTIGAGHLMRMLALGQILVDSGHKVHFATIPHESDITACLDSEPFIVHRLKANSQQSDFISIANGLIPDWIVLDSYSISTEFEQEIRRSGHKVVRINDLSEQHTVADVLLDQNFGADQFMHSVEPYTIKLTGLQHVLLRREFRKLSVRKTVNTDAEEIRFLIALGGGSQVTDVLHLVLIKILAQIFRPQWSLTLIIGRMGNNSTELQKVVKKFPFPIQVIKHTSSMAKEFLNSDIAIVSGGSIMWESLFMKVPFMAISLNARQNEYINILEKSNLCWHLGSIADICEATVSEKIVNFSENKALRNSIILNATNLFNSGLGSSTLLEIIEKDWNEVRH